jgi:hypothetical protein
MAGIGIMIIGQSGTGKSTSIKTLPPERTGIINVVSKRLPFKNSVAFRTVNSDKTVEIMKVMTNCKADVIVVDDIQFVLVNEFMRSAEQKGYEKFTKMQKSYWDVFNHINTLPENKTVYFLSHSMTDEFGNERAKTLGKMLDEKITLEALFPIVMKTVVKNGQYFFSTKNSGSDTVKTPLDMFAEELIPNDLGMVDKTIREYYGIQ